jgi:hypothetical protein
VFAVKCAMRRLLAGHHNCTGMRSLGGLGDSDQQQTVCLLVSDRLQCCSCCCIQRQAASRISVVLPTLQAAMFYREGLATARRA